MLSGHSDKFSSFFQVRSIQSAINSMRSGEIICPPVLAVLGERAGRSLFYPRCPCPLSKERQRADLERQIEFIGILEEYKKSVPELTNRQIEQFKLSQVSERSNSDCLINLPRPARSTVLTVWRLCKFSHVCNLRLYD